MLLTQIIGGSFKDIEITNIQTDSRLIKSGGLFVALDGRTNRGIDFVDKALENGAVAVICDEKENYINEQIPVVKVADVMTTLGQALNKFYALKPKHIIGITGTSGKTSVAEFTRQALEMLGHKSASIGSLGMKYGNEYEKNDTLTMKELVDLHEKLNFLKTKKGTKYVAMEFTSQGMHQRRNEGLDVELGVFNNITPEHLDYHKDMGEYFKQKMLLFNSVLKRGSNVVLNADIPEFERIKDVCIKRNHNILSYGENHDIVKFDCKTLNKIDEGDPYKQDDSCISFRNRHQTECSVTNKKIDVKKNNSISKKKVIKKILLKLINLIKKDFFNSYFKFSSNKDIRHFVNGSHYENNTYYDILIRKTIIENLSLILSNLSFSHIKLDSGKHKRVEKWRYYKVFVEIGEKKYKVIFDTYTTKDSNNIYLYDMNIYDLPVDVKFPTKDNHIQILSIKNNFEGQEVIFAYRDKEYTFATNFIGKFQVANLFATLGIILQLNIENDVNKILRVLEQVKPADGRLQLAGQKKNGALIYVDYAHKPDALEKVLIAMREHINGIAGARIGVLFGCGGDRDKTKRPVMGRIAQELADFVIVTDDNCRTEDPDVIRSEIMVGCPHALNLKDRKIAIAKAIEMLQPKDLLILAGKGHEKYNIVGKTEYPFDEFEIVREIVK